MPGPTRRSSSPTAASSLLLPLLLSTVDVSARAIHAAPPTPIGQTIYSLYTRNPHPGHNIVLNQNDIEEGLQLVTAASLASAAYCGSTSKHEWTCGQFIGRFAHFILLTGIEPQQRPARMFLDFKSCTRALTTTGSGQIVRMK